MAISSAVKPRSMSSSARTAGFAACLQPPSALVGDERRHGRALEGAIVRRSQVLACQRKVTPHPLHLIVLAPPAEISERRMPAGPASRSPPGPGIWDRS